MMSKIVADCLFDMRVVVWFNEGEDMHLSC